MAFAACALLSGTAQAQPQKAAGAEKLEAAADNLSRMKTSLKHVLGRAEQARNEKDVVKLNCVNEKLTQIKSLIKVAEQADIALHESVSSKDAGADTSFSKIAIARTKVDGLRGEAEQCIGQLAYMVDEKTTVEMEQPNLPGQRAAGLGIARRENNPADSVAALGGGQDSGYSGFPGYAGRTGYWNDADPTGGRGRPDGNAYLPPPIVNRPPAASPSR
jgi:hypothetical protein